MNKIIIISISVILAITMFISPDTKIYDIRMSDGDISFLTQVLPEDSSVAKINFGSKTSYTEELNLLLIDRLAWEKSSGYLREMYTMYRESSVPFNILLGTHVVESNFYPNTKIPKSYIPVKDKVVQWKVEQSGFKAEDVTLAKIDKKFRQTVGDVNGLEGDHDSANVFQIRKKYMTAGKDIFNLPDNIEYMETRYKNVLKVLGSDANKFTDEELSILYSVYHNGGPGIMMYRASMGIDNNNTSKIKDIDVTGLKEFASSLSKSFSSYNGQLPTRSNGTREIPLLLALKSGEWYLTEKYYDLIVSGGKDGGYTAWYNDNTVLAWEQVFGEKKTIKQIHDELRKYVKKVSDVNTSVDSSTVNKVYGVDDNYDSSGSNRAMIFRVSKTTSDKYTSGTYNLMGAINFLTLEHAFMVYSYAEKAYKESMEEVGMQYAPIVGQGKPNGGNQSMIPVQTVGERTDILAKLIERTKQGNPITTIDEAELLQIMIGAVGHYKYLYGGGKEVRNMKYNKDVNKLLSNNPLLFNYPADGYKLDCSSFTAWVMNQILLPLGHTFPTTTATLENEVSNTNESNLQIGDVFNTPNKHTGFFAGYAKELSTGRQLPVLIHCSEYRKSGQSGVLIHILNEKNSGKPEYEVEYIGKVMTIKNGYADIGKDWCKPKKVNWSKYGVTITRSISQSTP